MRRPCGQEYDEKPPSGKVNRICRLVTVFNDGAGIYKDNNEAFATLDKLDVIEPNVAKRQEYADAYAKWKYRLEKSMTGNIPAPVLSSDK